jgi:hypothetical protein
VPPYKIFVESESTGNEGDIFGKVKMFELFSAAVEEVYYSDSDEDSLSPSLHAE